MDELKELTSIIRARFPIVLIETHEEPRARQLLEKLANLEEQALFSWSVADGLCRAKPNERVAQTHNLQEALRHIDQSPQNGLYVLCDAHPFLDNPINVRLVREIALDYYKSARTLVFISPKLELPSELLRVSARFRLSLPNRARIKDIIRTEAQLWKSQSGEALRGEQQVLELLVMHLQGLDEEDVLRLVRQAIRDDGAITRSDLERVLRFKHEAFGGAGMLHYENDVAHFDDIGGLGQLKHWLEMRRQAFVTAEEDAGQDRPKGVLLLGVQGGGKSLAARAIAGQWGLPLMRLDFASLYAKFHGDTERNLRAALETAEGMAPCVLWIDELEKGLASDSGGESDGGVSRRVLGTLLTWLSSKRKPVFIVATANDISQLPPELIRKGRFDEIFFVDLPQAQAREAIVTIHLKRRKFMPEDFDVALLAGHCNGFAGAEIEQAIVSALFEARTRGEALANAHIEAEMRRTRPLSVVMSERIDALRDWANARAVSAD
jgi:SpoVK/Ycf46/Vps4 family AAA+-type ATPase